MNRLIAIFAVSALLALSAGMAGSLRAAQTSRACGLTGDSGCETLVASRSVSLAQSAYGYAGNSTGQAEGVIAPSQALHLAMSHAPGSQPLGVRLLQGPRLMYAVKLKTGTVIHRVLVDAHSGQVISQ